MRFLVPFIVLSAVVAAAAGPAEWVPARWHSHDIATLAELQDNPINCLLLEEADQDRVFVRAASERHIATLAVVRPRDSATLTRALSSGVDGVVFEGDFELPLLDTLRQSVRAAGRIPIELPSRARIRLDTDDPIAGTNQGLWPGLEIEHNGKTIVGPTSSPWINTNGGFLRFLRARTGAIVWLAVDPPPGTIFPVDRYLQAVGDAAIPGARWVISLDADLEKRLHAHDAAALADWKRLSEILRFYEQFRRYSNFGTFGVVMDRDTGGLLSSFLLDMLAAQRTSARIIPPGRVTASSLDEVKVLLDLESASLNPAEHKAMDDFVARGGTVLNPPPSAKFPEPSPARMLPERRDLDRLQSLWEMVYNATLRKNFGVRAFNTIGILTGVMTPDGGRTVTVQLLNFLDYPGEAITVHALGTWKRARLIRPDGPPQNLSVYPVKEGTAVDLDRFATAVAIQFQ